MLSAGIAYVSVSKPLSDFSTHPTIVFAAIGVDIRDGENIPGGGLRAVSAVRDPTDAEGALIDRCVFVQRYARRRGRAGPGVTSSTREK
jgi:hypothetical protein